jgi:nucleoid-associated protein YgaU
MMISADSRYADSALATLTKDGNDVAVIVSSAQVAYSFTFIHHTVTLGERIETIAYQYYADAKLWWRIADANPEILWWDNLTPGTVLRIPSV